VLAVGILHQIFDASNNNGALVDSVLDGVDAGNMTQLAAVVLTVLIAAWLLWHILAHSPNVRYRFQIHLGRLGSNGRRGGGGRRWSAGRSVEMCGIALRLLAC